MTLQPLADRLVAKPVEAETKTASGFMIPESGKEKPQMAEVIAVGKEVKEVKAGDRILYAKYGPTEVNVDEATLLLLKEEDVLAVVSGK